MTSRTLQRVIPSLPASDGAGVKLRRSLGASQFQRHDPWLMLDEFYSDDPKDYLAGFPNHPHRGFETITYMLDGHMRHEDSSGNRGDLGPGDVQWMSAARGVIHSEMPQQTEGRMRGFQLWLNLPAREKMNRAAYRDIKGPEIPVVAAAKGAHVRVIAGALGEVAGPIQRPSTQPQLLDVHLAPGAILNVPVKAGHNGFVYVYEGEAGIGADGSRVPQRAAGLLSDGDEVHLQAGEAGARLLLIAGKPIGEPVVQYGPFVMNSREEIEQAILDYQSGELTRGQVGRIELA